MRRALAIACMLAALPVALRAQGAPESSPATGVIEGQVRWSGPIFEPREVLWPEGVRGSDLALEDLVHGARVLDEAVRVDPASRGIADCCVRYLGARMRPHDGPAAVIEIAKLRFSPRAAALLPGQVFAVVNADPIAHDLEVSAFDGSILLQKRVEPAQRVECGAITGDGVILRAKRFPFMAAVVYAGLEGPQMITAANGTFRFAGVPAGKAPFEIIHPLLGRRRFDVDVAPGETARWVVCETDLVTVDPAPRVFADGGDAAMTVDGVAVPKEVIERLTAFMHLRHGAFALPPSFVAQYVVRQAVLPVAATVAARADVVKGLLARAEVVKKMIEAGRGFDEVAAEMTEEEGGAEATLLQERSRLDFDPILGERVFAARKGTLVGPCFSARGLHFFVVEGIVGSKETETRTVRHLVLRYDPKTPPEVADRRAAELAARAKVVCHDASLRDAIPAASLK
jgi:hypothetical protein